MVIFYVKWKDLETSQFIRRMKAKQIKQFGKKMSMNSKRFSGTKPEIISSRVMNRILWKMSHNRTFLFFGLTVHHKQNKHDVLIFLLFEILSSSNISVPLFKKNGWGSIQWELIILFHVWIFHKSWLMRNIVYKWHVMPPCEWLTLQTIAAHIHFVELCHGIHNTHHEALI